MDDPTMTAEEIAPMGDAELEKLRGDVAWALRNGHGATGIPADTVSRLLARLALAESRALPAPRLMESLEDVRRLPDGAYQFRRTVGATVPCRKIGQTIQLPAARHNETCGFLVGTYVSGPLPEIDLPGERG